MKSSFFTIKTYAKPFWKEYVVDKVVSFNNVHQ